jgi:N-acetylmuramoyl-L-alanine amidase
VVYVRLPLSPGGGRPGIPLKAVRGVVVHWTANTDPGADAIANRNYFEGLNKSRHPVSAHYTVDDKQVVQCIPETEVAYHAGAYSAHSPAQPVLGATPNAVTIGVEWCVNEDASGAETYRNVVVLCGDILFHHKLPLSRLFRHFDINGSPCPRFFTDDEWAAKMGMLPAKDAWKAFKRDVRIAVRAFEMATAKEGATQ